MGDRNPCEPAPLNQCPRPCPVVGNVPPLQPIRVGQARSPQPSPVCEPEPDCPEPEAANWNIMDQGLQSCPFDLMEPQARLYDPSMQVCPEPGSPIPMGISEQERMAAIFEFDPCYTGPSPQSRTVTFQGPTPGTAEDLASVFGCPPAACPPPTEDVCELPPPCPPPTADVCEPPPACPPADCEDDEDGDLGILEIEEVYTLDDEFLTAEPRGAVEEAACDTDDDLGYFEVDEIEDQTFAFDPNVGENFDEFQLRVNEPRRMTVDECVLRDLEMNVSELPSKRMALRSRKYKYEDCLKPPPVFFGPHLPPGGLPPPSPEPEPETACPPPQAAPPPQAPLRLSEYYYPDMPNFEAKYPKYDPKKHRSKEMYERMKEMNLDVQKRSWVVTKGLYARKFYPNEAACPPEQKAGPSGVTCRKPTKTAGQGQGGVRPKSKLNAPGTSGVTGRKPTTGTRRGQQGAPAGRGTGLKRSTAETNCPPPGGRGQQRPMTGHDVDMDLVRGNIATPGAAPPPRACPPKQSRLSQLAQGFYTRLQPAS